MSNGFLGLDLDDAERQIGDWQASIDQRAAQAQDLSRRLSTLTATARSDDGLVEATVTSSGALVDLRLNEGIRSQPASWTAHMILAALRDARSKLVVQVQQAVGDTVGLESATGQLTIRSLTAQFAALDAPTDRADGPSR